MKILKKNPLLFVKKNTPLITLIGVFACNAYYLYLLDAHHEKIAGIIAQDFALILAIIWGIYYWIKMIKLSNPIFRYGIWMLSFIVLAVLSSLQSCRLYGQSFILGFAPQRWVFIWALLYFPIRKLLYHKMIRYESLINMIKAFGILQLILFILQYFLRNVIEYMHVSMGYRNGAIRYYYLPILIDFLFLLSLDKFNNAKGTKKVMAVICSGAILFETMFVQQFRLTTMGLVISLMLFIMFLKNKQELKILYFILGSVAIVFLFNTSIVQNVIYTVLHNAYDSGTKIRIIGRELYFETVFRHPFLGGGYPSTFYRPAARAAGAHKKIFLYDNGIFGFMYIYGLTGIIWFMTLWKRIIKDGIIIQKEMKELAFLLFPIFFLITGINEIHWYWEYGFVVFSIYLCLIESKLAIRRYKKCELFILNQV